MISDPRLERGAKNVIEISPWGNGSAERGASITQRPSVEKRKPRDGMVALSALSKAQRIRARLTFPLTDVISGVPV
jgi:hypothetical protein